MAFAVSALLKVFRGTAERSASTVQQVLSGTGGFWSVTISDLGPRELQSIDELQVVACTRKGTFFSAVLAFQLKVSRQHAAQVAALLLYLV